MGIEGLERNLVFTIFAYLCGFVPWTIISVYDFLSNRWKPLGKTIGRGWIIFLFSIFPVFYVSFYVYLQLVTEDYTEACTAMVALIFALFHGARSAWGLWQLYHFRQWVVKSVKSLKEMGIHYDLHGKVAREGPEDDLFPDKIADGILVNNIVVDNLFSGGRTSCCLKYGTYAFPMQREQPSNLTVRKVVRAVEFLNCCVSLLSSTLKYLLGRLLNRKRELHFLRMVPINPVDVWLTWATVFAAQGLEDWIKEFSVAPNPGRDRGSQETAVESFGKKVTFFRAEVLSSAIVHLLPEILPSTTVPTPFFWKEWNEKSQMAAGLFTHSELLQQAVSKRELMPFGYGLNEEDPGDKHFFQSIKEDRGFTSYHRKLQNIISELPNRKEFSAEVDENWGILNIEYLAILLYLGHTQINEHLERKDEGTAAVGGTHFSMSGPVGGNPKTKDHSAQAMSNLRHQLFSIDIKEKIETSEINFKEMESYNKPSTWPSFPFYDLPWDSYVPEPNKHVSGVGIIIDIWSALSAGSDINFLLKQLNNKWKEWCLGECSSDRNAGSYNSAEHSSSSNVSEKSIRNRRMRGVHAELEIRRIRSQYVNKEVPESQIEQFMIFMGYRMEEVRTNLGIFFRATEHDSDEKFSEPFERAQIPLSNPFRQVLERPEILLRRRGVQVRLIWELQKELSSRGKKSMQSDTILLCILSYPSLHVDNISLGDEGNSSHSSTPDHHCIPFGCKTSDTNENYQRNTSRQVEMKIEATCAPQNCWIICTLGLGDCGPYAKLRLTYADENFEFDWQCWRDSFIGRLQGQKEWFKQHLMPYPRVEEKEVEAKISEFDKFTTDTNEDFMTYVGWRPHRLGFNLYDLSQTKVLKTSREVQKNKQNSVSIPKFQLLEPVEVSYSDAKPEVLRHYSGIVQTAKPSELRCPSPHGSEGDREEATSQTTSVSSHDSQTEMKGTIFQKNAKAFASQGRLEAAAQFYEIDALKRNDPESLQKCAHILTSKTMARKNPFRIFAVLDKFVAKLSDLRRGNDPAMYSNCNKGVLEICLSLVHRYGHLPHFRKYIMDFLSGYFYILGNEETASKIAGLVFAYERRFLRQKNVPLSSEYYHILSIIDNISPAESKLLIPNENLMSLNNFGNFIADEDEEYRNGLQA